MLVRTDRVEPAKRVFPTARRNGSLLLRKLRPYERKSVNFSAKLTDGELRLAADLTLHPYEATSLPHLAVRFVLTASTRSR